MNDSAKDSNASKRPSLVPGANVASPGASPEPNRVLASLGGASVAKAKPPLQKHGHGLGIWVGAVLMFVAGSASTWLYGNWAPNQAPAPSAQITKTESPPTVEPQPQPEAAHILNVEPTVTPTAPAMEAALQPASQTSVAEATQSIIATASSSTAASSPVNTVFAATGKVNPAKSTKPDKTVSAARHSANKTVEKRNNKHKGTNATTADPDVNVIEALLRNSLPAADTATTGAHNKEGAKTHSSGMN